MGRKPASSYERIYAAVRRIPKGKVATYGQIARIAGLGGHARQVGYALAACEGHGVPWHRVVNAQGQISPRSVDGPEELQRALLREEGVELSASGRIDFRRHRWRRGLA